MDQAREIMSSSKKVDALIVRILQLCEDEGASITEVKMLARRFERVALQAVEDAVAGIQFTCSLPKDC